MIHLFMGRDVGTAVSCVWRKEGEERVTTNASLVQESDVSCALRALRPSAGDDFPGTGFCT